MYAVVDLETTGGFALRNRITEVAIYRHDGHSILDEFHSLVNPERSIPSYITSLTGITNDMVASAPIFKDIASTIDEFTKDHVLVAHNAGFDYSFLRREFRSLGSNYIRKKLCTVRLSRKIVPGLHSYSLGTLCATLGITISDRHRAFGDAKATVELLEYLMQNDQMEHIPNALKKNSREGTLPPNLPREEFDQLPDEVGVYYFLDKKGRVIYVGKAKNIRGRILSHFQQFGRSKRSMDFRNQISNITYELCGNELIAYLLESHEIKRYWPQFNRSQRFTKNCWGVHQYLDQNGYFRLIVAKTKPSDVPIISFKTFDQTWDFLRSQVEKHSLCKRLCNIQTMTNSCLDYPNGNCAGACVEEEPCTSYNRRVMKCIENFSHLNNSYLLLGKGRNHEETSLVWVENGKYKGFGFAEDAIQEKDIQELTHNIKPYADNQDIQRIISTYMNTYPQYRQIKL